MSQPTREALPYVPGIYAEPTLGNPLPQEAKSPPLSEVFSAGPVPQKVSAAPYHEPGYIEIEACRVFGRQWLCAGPEADLRAPGDWFRFDIGPRSCVVVRGRDGRVRAFHNACQHRGHRLAGADLGNTTQFTCPFHGWRYDLEGRCRAIPSREFFTSNALSGSCDLPSIACDTAAGLVFVSFDTDPPTLAEWLGPIPQNLEAYDLRAMHVVADTVVDVAANWKLVKHANLEAYHFPLLHPLALPLAEDLRQQVDFYRNGHNRFITTNGNPSSRLARRTELDGGQRFMLQEVGIDPDRFTDGPYKVRRAIQLAKRAHDNPFGIDYKRFSDNQLTDDWSFSLFPNTSLNVHPEGALLMRYLPDSIDPARSRLHVMVLCPRMKPGARPPSYMGVPADADVSGKTRPARRQTSGNAPGLGWALDDDVFAVEEVQKGVRSGGFSELRLSQLEQRIQHFCAQYSACIATGDGSGKLSG